MSVVELRTVEQDPDPEDGEEGAVAAEAERGRRRRRPPWGKVAFGLLALLLVAAAVAAFVEHDRADDLAGDVEARRSVATQAGAFAEALLSYDAASLDAARERVLALATPSFGEEYATAFDEQLGAVIGELGAVSTATVREVYVQEVDGATAKAIAVVDSTVRSTAGDRSLTGSYLQVDLERVDGEWLVAAATAVGAEDETVEQPG